MGRDRLASTSARNLAGFNPRAPRGARRSALSNYESGQRVSIHAPRVGRDTSGGDYNFVLGLFQSTRPAWGATQMTISIPAMHLFQSTRPAWGATPPRCFNPRAPRGARRGIAAKSTHGCCFNPRAPRGARLDFQPRLRRNVLFQSTRPAWGATRIFRGDRNVMMFQSTRPAWGATLTSIAGGTGYLVSIHAPRVGRDPKSALLCA